MRLHVLSLVAPLFLAVVVVLIGCASKPPAKPQQSAGTAAKSLAVDTTPEVVHPATPATAPAHDLLAEQMASYKSKLEQVLEKKQAGAAAEDPAAGAPATTKPSTRPDVLKPTEEETDPVAEVPSEGTTPAARPAKPKRAVASADEPDAESQPARPTVNTDELLRRLSARAKEYPRDLSVHLDFQLLQLLRDEKVPGMPDIASLPAEDHELLAALLDALSNFRSAVQRDNNMLQAEKVRPLIELGRRLRAQSELSIPTLALCRKVKTFGVYDPIEPEFAAGRAQEVLIYCEVENFASQFNEQQQQWETKLSQDVVLYTETGLPIWQAKHHVATDLSRNRRHDFFTCQRTLLPASLTIGRYLMKVSVVDQNANRIAESTLPLKVVARATNPSSAPIAGPGAASAPTTAPQFPGDAAAATLVDPFNK